MSQKSFRDELKSRFSWVAGKAKTQRAPAINLFCKECMCSFRAKEACEVRDCFLWPHSPFGGKAKPEKDEERSE